MRIVTSVEAQNRFGELLDSAQREPVTITRRGRTVAFILSPEDMKDLLDVRHTREPAVTEFEAFFEKKDARLQPDSRTLSEETVRPMVNGLR